MSSHKDTALGSFQRRPLQEDKLMETTMSYQERVQVYLHTMFKERSVWGSAGVRRSPAYSRPS